MIYSLTLSLSISLLFSLFLSISSLQFMIFSNHEEDSSCSSLSLVEGHGYAADYCHKGVGELNGFYWMITRSQEQDNGVSILHYKIFEDSECLTDSLADSTIATNDCEKKEQTGVKELYKRISLSSNIPQYSQGTIVKGYSSHQSCKNDDSKVLSWSYLKEKECDPQSYSPINGLHESDESRSCRNGKVEATLHASKDLSCTTPISSSVSNQDCIWGSVTGGEGVYRRAFCV